MKYRLAIKMMMLINNEFNANGKYNDKGILSSSMLFACTQCQPNQVYYK